MGLGHPDASTLTLTLGRTILGLPDAIRPYTFPPPERDKIRQSILDGAPINQRTR